MERTTPSSPQAANGPRTASTQPQDAHTSRAETATEARWLAHCTLWVAAAVLGAVTSLGVWLFLQGFALIDRLTLGTFGALPPPVGWLATALIPAVGGLLVGLGMRALSRPARLAAMAHVIDGVAAGAGRLDLRNGAAFVVNALIGIGFGAPVGADTPAALIGGHLGSWLAQRLRWREDFVRALVVAGVTAGIAATYFAQLSAVFFGIEVVLGGIGGPVFVIPTLIAVVASTLVTGSLGGQPARYATPAGAEAWGPSLLVYAGAAILAAIAAIVYVNLLPITRAAWSLVTLPYWAKPALAGLLVGVVGIWLPDVFGTGLSQMKSIFAGAALPLQLLIVLALAKLVLTPNSLGAGFAGGVIGPALLIGSWLGAAYGMLIAQVVPGLEVSPVALSMVATTAMLAATFHAPLFATMMIFEMVGDLRFLVPLTLGAAIAYGLGRFLQPGSAYTFGFPAMGLKFVPGTYMEVRVDHERATPR
jgi:CIC family chloride channel protein